MAAPAQREGTVILPPSLSLLGVTHFSTRWGGIWAATSEALLNPRNSFTTTCIRSPGSPQAFSQAGWQHLGACPQGPWRCSHCWPPMGTERQQDAHLPRSPEDPRGLSCPATDSQPTPCTYTFHVLKENVLESTSTTYKVHWSTDTKLTWRILARERNRHSQEEKTVVSTFSNRVFCPQGTNKFTAG